MKKILILILLPFMLILAQDDKSKNPNVELPDFVITGKDSVSIKRAEKIKPDFVSTITENFVKPVHSPEELGLRQLSSPLKEDPELLSSRKSSNGNISAGAGNSILPNAMLSYRIPFDDGMLRTYIGGMNQKAYVDNSDRYMIHGGAEIEYTTKITNEVLPGTQFLLGGNYSAYSYKLFASDDPNQKRSKNEGNYSLGIKNTAGKVFIFDLQLNDHFTSLIEDNFTENNIQLKGFTKLQVGDVGIGINADYQKQFLDTDSLSNINFDYIFVRSYASFEILNSVLTKVGYSYSKSGNMEFGNVYASFGLKLSPNLVLLGEYTPFSEFVTPGILLRNNDYFNTNGVTNLFYKKTNFIDVSVKYEYNQYYQVEAGLRYFKSANQPYFISSDISGQFDLRTADVTNYNPYVNLLFHLGPYGFFYGSVDYYHVRDNNGNEIPYQPYLKGDMTYGYKLSEKLLSEISLDFYSDRYTDTLNTEKLNAILNLSFKVSYKLNDMFLLTLELSNLLDRDIFLWEGYKEKPFDVLVGFNLMFD